MRGANRTKTAKARRLRRAQTDAERKLWYRLSNRQLARHKFVRQDPIGPYIADFVCRESRLVVELDGSQHAESAHDRVRDAFLVERGYRVLRFWNHEVMKSPDSVLDTIFAALGAAPSPRLRGEGRAPLVGGEASAAERSEGEGLPQYKARSSTAPHPLASGESASPRRRGEGEGRPP
jgi:very-short-patch-repair endonuclease